MAELWSIIIVSLISILAAIGALFFKKSSEKFSLSFAGLFKNKNLVIGVALYAITTIVFVFSLKGGELSVLYPLVSTSYVWAAIFSNKFLGEGFNRYKLFGMALIFIGVVIVAVG